MEDIRLRMSSQGLKGMEEAWDRDCLAKHRVDVAKAQLKLVEAKLKGIEDKAMAKIAHAWREIWGDCSSQKPSGTEGRATQAKEKFS